MKNHLYHYPTVEEMRALEMAAHRARSRETLRLIRAGASGLKGLLERLAGLVAHGGERLGHA